MNQKTVTVVDGYVPVIDISSRHEEAGRAALADVVGTACANSGFFVIVDHGVPQGLVERMYSVTNEFFRLPDAQKDTVAHRPGVSGFHRFPGSFVVNIGDLMALWTGGRWVSTMHRVVNPGYGDTSSRLSIPFFYQPNHDAIVEPLRSAPSGESARVIAGQWMAEKTAKLFSN